MKAIFSFILIQYVFLMNATFAEPQKGNLSEAISLRPEAISAKMVIEQLLERRYAQGLSVFLDRKYFNVGVELVLDEVKKDKKSENQKNSKKTEIEEAIDDGSSLPTDLLLGSLEMDEVLKGEMVPELRERIDQFISAYQVKTVNISVGILSTLGDAVKAKTEKYLNDRVNAEFGTAGKTVVSYLFDPAEQKKNWLDHVGHFQILLGLLSLALALFLGSFLWSFSTKKQKIDQVGKNTGSTKNETEAGAESSTGASAGSSASSGGGYAGAAAGSGAAGIAGVAAGASGGSGGGVGGTQLSDDANQVTKDIAHYSQRLVGLFQRTQKENESVFRIWCESGDEGLMKIACFAEAMGGEMGKLPIPVDSASLVTQAFSKMPEVSPLQKRNILVKIYWDLMMALNLGTETLERPFAYLSSMKTSMINQVLVDQNPKMKALVSLFMPDSARNQYISGQDENTKLELLKHALDLNEIASDELRAQDDQFKAKLHHDVDFGKETVAIDSAFLKVLRALTPVEEMTLLSQIKGSGIESYKRTYASLAFLSEWQDSVLKVFLAKAKSEEVVAYLRVFPEQKFRIVELCPYMTAEVVNDDFPRPETAGIEVRNEVLRGFVNRLQAMIQSREISLEKAFKEAKLKLVESETEDKDDEKKAA